MERRTFIGPFGVEFYADNLAAVKPKKEKPKVSSPKPVPEKAQAEPVKKERVNAHLEIPGWDEIRKKILDRDGHICQECPSASQLTVHHKDRNRRNNSDDNLVTLCWSCHKKKHWGKK